MPALIWTLIIYLFLGVALLGWGTAAARILGIGKGPNLPWFEATWLGFSFALLALNLVHLILPLTAYIAIPFLVSGVLLAIPRMTRGLRRPPPRLQLSKTAAALAVIVLLAATWIALRSLTQAPDNYDSGLYHLSAIRWTYSYPVVLGLGNLHGRLAFNSSLFPFVAALDFQPFFGHGYAIANSFLLVLAIASIARFLIPLVNNPSLLLVSHPFRYAASLFALPPLVYVALSASLSSPTPELASTIIQIVLFLMLCESIARWREGYRAQTSRATIILVLAVSAVTIKLSNLGYSLGIAGFVIAYWLRTSHAHTRSFAQIFMPSVVIALVWGFRGFLLSGAPLYPSTIGYIPVDWAVPRSAVVEEANWVYSWARQPGHHWSTVLSSWAWLGPWLERLSKDFVGSVYPLSMSALACILAAAISFASKTPASHRLPTWKSLTPIARLGCGVVIGMLILVVIELMFLRRLVLPGIQQIVTSAYYGEAPGVVQAVFTTVATDRWKTGLDAYLLKADRLYDTAAPVLTCGLALGIFLWAAWVLFPMWRRHSTLLEEGQHRPALARKLEWSILFPCILGLTYWFFTAPDLRFANALFFLLSVCSCLLLLISLQPIVKTRAFAVVLCVVFLLGNAHFLQYSISNKWLPRQCATRGWIACISSATWQPPPAVPLNRFPTSSGLEVLVPASGDQCWDAPLPCTPYFNSGLRLAKPGLLSSGFAVTLP